jgi:hypothetical protein
LNRQLKRLIKILSSLKFAVAILIGFAFLSAIGTIIESRYDADYAKALVYESVYMRILSISLAICLTAVMVDRWPWKKQHTGFIMAHIGILILMFGMWLTANYGVDGTLSFGFGESSRFVTLPQREVQIFATSAEGENTKLLTQAVDFLRNPPTPKAPFTLSVSGKQIVLKDYYHFAKVEQRVVPSERTGDGPGVRFALSNSRANFSEWLVLSGTQPSKSIELGPATVTLAKESIANTVENELIFFPLNNSASEKHIGYKIFLKNKVVKTGKVKAGDSLATGWMDLTLRVFSYYPKAKNEMLFEKLQRPSPMSTSALLVNFDGQEQWVPLNSLTRFFDSEFSYAFYFGQKRMPLNFELKLNKFNVGRYQGTIRAASYESEVELPNKEVVTISMNNPLKMDGYTFYQASFQEDENGQPTASILSVNWDPGRLLKYLGSLLIVLGSSILFWFKRAKIFKNKPT